MPTEEAVSGHHSSHRPNGRSDAGRLRSIFDDSSNDPPTHAITRTPSASAPIGTTTQSSRTPFAGSTSRTNPSGNTADAANARSAPSATPATTDMVPTSTHSRPALSDS